MTFDISVKQKKYRPWKRSMKNYGADSLFDISVGVTDVTYSQLAN